MDRDTLRREIRARMPEAISTLRAKATEHAPDRPAREAGYRIVNATGQDGDTAVVRIYDEIWFLGVNAEDFVADLDTVTAPKIRVEINSPGGDVFDAVAIHNALRVHPAHVTTRVDGIAASAASLIVQAGDHRIMLSSAQMMIHDAWALTIGDERDHGARQELLQQQDAVIAGIYASRSGKDADHFRTLMDAETWLTDQGAVDEGLADEVIDPPRQTQDRAPTLHDEISEALDVVSAVTASAERLDASCAEKGQQLSRPKQAALDELAALTGRLHALLTDPEPGDGETNDGLQREFARFVATTQRIGASQ